MDAAMQIHFKALKGRRSKLLRDMFDEPVILELSEGQTYGGVVDEYYYNGGGVLALYSCKLLDKSMQKWVDHDIFMRQGNRKIRDPMPEFFVRSIRRILMFSGKIADSISLEDVLQLYLDPHFRPIRGVKCSWKEASSKSHSIECESRLHEALALMTTESEVAISQTTDRDHRALERRIEESFSYIRRRLLMSGARIP